MAHAKSNLNTVLVIAMLVLLLAGVISAYYAVDAKVYVDSLTFSPDARHLAVTSDIGATFYESDTGQIVFEVPAGRDVMFAPDSHRVAVRTHQAIALYEIPSGEQRAEYQTKGVWISSMAFSPDGKLLATLGARSNPLQVLNAETMSLLWSVQAHEDADHAIAFSPDGRFIATGGSDHNAKSSQIRLWDAVHGTLMQTIEVNRHAFVNQAIFVDGGKTLVVVFSDGKANIVYDISNLEEIRKTSGHSLAIYSGPVVLSQDGRYAAMFWSTDDSWTRAAAVIDLMAGYQIMRTGADFGLKWNAAFDSKNESLLLATSAGTVSTWDLISGRRLRTITGVRPSRATWYWYLFGGACVFWIVAWIAVHRTVPNLAKGNDDCILVPLNGAMASLIIFRWHWILVADPWRSSDPISALGMLPLLSIGCLVVFGALALATRSGHAFFTSVGTFLSLSLLSAAFWIMAASNV